MLRDALQALHLGALEEFYENGLMDPFVSVYVVADQDAVVLEELVRLENAGLGGR